MAEEQLFYRFRTLKHIFEYKELENQEIYFAPTEQLNDPMEGHKTIVFNGDKIVWKNLFKHYLICLFEVILLNAISRKELDNSFSIADIHYKSIGYFYGNVHLQCLFSYIYDEFFYIFDEEIDKINKQRYDVTIDELSIYLSDIHDFALELINSITSNKKLDTFENNKIIAKNKLTQSIDYFIKYHQNEEKIFLFKINKTSVMDTKDNNFIKTRFISEYIKTLKKLVSPNELIACFSDKVDNFLMWSHYAESHKGVCLIFNTCKHNNLPSINIKDISLDKYTIGSFYKVKYGFYNQPINFFENIHLTTQSIYRDFWYLDSFLIPEGNKSIYYHENVYDIYDEKSMQEYDKNNKFLDNYFEKVTVQILFKLDDWKDEKEYRLVTFDFVDQIPNIKGKIYQYKFDSLNGIIFGLNTPFEDRLSIINIIKNKCIKENRKDFKFYEMQIDEENGKLKQIPLKIDFFNSSLSEPTHE